MNSSSQYKMTKDQGGKVSGLEYNTESQEPLPPNFPLDNSQQKKADEKEKRHLEQIEAVEPPRHSSRFNRFDDSLGKGPEKLKKYENSNAGDGIEVIRRYQTPTGHEPFATMTLMTADAQRASSVAVTRDDIIVPEAVLVPSQDEKNDSIPSATVVQEEKFSLTIAGRKFHMRYFIIGALILVGVVISMAVTLSRKNETTPIAPPSVNSPDTFVAPSNVPSSSLRPSSSPSSAPSSHPTSQLFAEIASIISRDLNTNTSVFLDAESPERITLDWLVNDQLDTPYQSFALPDPSGSAYTVTGSSLTEAEILERYALALIFHETKGNDWHNSFNFMTSGHVCSWRAKESYQKKGVLGCDDSNTRVTRLELYNNNLKGSLPTEIGLLTKLSFLRIDNNDISGNLPHTLGTLSQMSHLQVNNNDFTGNIPDSMESLGNLQLVDLSNNELRGKLINVENWTMLQTFKVDGNQLTGEVPSSFGNLKDLDTIHIHRNQLSGSIDFFCVDLPSDLQLDCDGDIPEVICNCCLGCTLSEDDNCDPEIEKIIALNITMDNDSDGFLWELTQIDPSTGTPVPIAVGGEYDEVENFEIQFCLSFPGEYILETTSTSGGVDNGFSNTGIFATIDDFSLALDENDLFFFSFKSDGSLTTQIPTLPPTNLPPTASPQTVPSPTVPSPTFPSPTFPSPTVPSPTVPSPTISFPSIGNDSSIVLPPTISPPSIANDGSILLPPKESPTTVANDMSILIPTNVPPASISSELSTDSPPNPPPSPPPPNDPKPTSPPSAAPSVSSQLCSLNFDLTLVTDGFGEETEWILFDENDGVVVESGNNLASNETYTLNRCLHAGGCYSFVIEDSFGDGICCGSGEGYFNISVNSRNIGYGGNFEYSDVVILGGNCGENPFNGSNCPSNHFLLEVSILTDARGRETSWEVFDVSTGKVVALNELELGTNSLNQVSKCIIQSDCYNFVIRDDNGDGMIDGAYYSVEYNGKLVANGGGNFGQSESTQFGDNCSI